MGDDGIDFRWPLGVLLVLTAIAALIEPDLEGLVGGRAPAILHIISAVWGRVYGVIALLVGAFLLRSAYKAGH